MAEIAAGSVVRLNSGGPAMTVGQVASRGAVECKWLDGTELKAGIFHMDALAPAEPAGGSRAAG